LIQKKLSERETSLIGDLEHVLSYINEVTENVRRLSRDLSPSILEDLGLSASLQWLFKEVSRIYQFDIIDKRRDTPDRFSKEKEIMVFRIFQEIFNNVGKHARADRVSVTSRQDKDKILFVVEDNGKGFDMKEVLNRDATDRGMGLAAIYERVRMVNGSLDIRSREGEGTRITFNIPVDKGDEK